MIRIDYAFTAKTPLHTGSDDDAGTMKMLRRQKIILENPIIYDTAHDYSSRCDAIVAILYAVHKSIDFEKFNQNRLRGLWDEMYSKIIKAGSCQTKSQFLDRLCSSWGIRAIEDSSIVNILDSMSDAEFFETIRNDTQYLVLKLRQKIKQVTQESSLFGKKEVQNKFVKTYELVPCISGNSIRGVLRRLAMYDYCKRVGITKLDKDTYHQWFTGGMMEEESMYEDIELRERIFNLNPMIALFGSALGRQTVESMMSVGFAYPECLELGTGLRSYWEYLDTVFQTRLDSSKTEREIEVVGKHDAPDQMKYEYEVFAPGTKFRHGFRMLEYNDLYVSAFWHVIKLFKQNPIITGMHARGNAEIDLSELPEGDDTLYISHIEEIKEDALGAFCG